jgi:hypothetical protein
LHIIDSLPLRKAIRTARNRTEAYHQLQGLIRKIYRGVFKGKKIVNNQVSAHVNGGLKARIDGAGFLFLIRSIGRF